MLTSAQSPTAIEVGILSSLAKILEALALLTAARDLEKARPDDPKHPGWPAGAPKSQGGEFRPKDEEREQVAGDVYATKDVRFGGLSPRGYFMGKSWEERQRVGLIGLRRIGVLK